ncbi:FAD-binding oxidoreductase [Sporomusa malonica]|nr:FAD-binding oxidoreductase [Sporomusa malonica]
MKLSLDGLTGKVVTPYSKEYEQARQEWNRAIQKFPIIIVYCYAVKDIQNAICWARRHGIGIRIRSRGHHYQGYSVGTGVLVIDVSYMKRIELDESNGSVFVQSGIKNREIYDYLGARGYPFPGGTCPTVGVAGYTLGGGWGYSSRYMGLGCDSLTALEMVDYQGNLCKADDNYNPDLFWACRGAGGGNFGVVTSMTFQLPPKVTRVTLVELEYLNAAPATMACFLDIWQEWLVSLDQRMTINVSMYNSAEDGMGIYGKGLFYGSAAEAAQILKPFELGGATLSLQEVTFLEAVQKIQDAYPDSEKFQSTGRFVNRKYSMEEIEAIVELIRQRADGSVYTAVSVYALGGKINEIDKKCTAFYYRDAAYIMGVQSVWEEDRYASVNRCWLNERFQCLKQLTVGSYINFPYNCLANYEEEYYGGNACRLQQIGRQYDPMNVFSFPQAIQ